MSCQTIAEDYQRPRYSLKQSGMNLTYLNLPKVIQKTFLFPTLGCTNSIATAPPVGLTEEAMFSQNMGKNSTVQTHKDLGKKYLIWNSETFL